LPPISPVRGFGNEWLAFGDESEPTDRYICAAAVLDVSAAAAIRAVMWELRRPNVRKLRWHDESAESRRKIIATLAGLDAMYVIAVRSCAPDETIASRRARCLSALVAELDAAEVERCVLESRGDGPDRKDQRLVAGMRASRRLPNGLAVEHMPGADEPLLWIADVVAGTYGAAVRGADDSFEAIAAMTQVIAVRP
jgi:hypothetical protein